MIASQPVEEVFRKACTVVIDNSGDFEATKRQIGDRLNKWECAVLQAAAVETVSM